MIQPNNEWSYAYHFSENMAAVFSNDSESSGYIDCFGNVVIPIKYDDAGDFCEGKAAVADDNGYYYILQNGNLLSRKYWDYAESFSNGFAVVYENHQAGYINHSGELNIPCIYKNALPANKDQTGWVSMDGSTYYLIDLINNTILSEAYMPAYEDISFPHTKQYYIVKAESGMGIVDNTGKVIVQPIWSYIYFDSNGDIVLGTS